MAEQLTAALLWTLAVLGAWNGLGMIIRFFYDETWWSYTPSIFFGLWAGSILLVR